MNTDDDTNSRGTTESDRGTSVTSLNASAVRIYPGAAQQLTYEQASVVDNVARFFSDNFTEPYIAANLFLRNYFNPASRQYIPPGVHHYTDAPLRPTNVIPVQNPHSWLTSNFENAGQHSQPKIRRTSPDSPTPGSRPFKRRRNLETSILDTSTKTTEDEEETPLRYYCGEPGCNAYRTVTDIHGLHPVKAHYQKKHPGLKFDHKRLVKSTNSKEKNRAMSPV